MHLNTNFWGSSETSVWNYFDQDFPNDTSESLLMAFPLKSEDRGSFWASEIGSRGRCQNILRVRIYVLSNSFHFCDSVWSMLTVKLQNQTREIYSWMVLQIKLISRFYRKLTNHFSTSQFSQLIWDLFDKL